MITWDRTQGFQAGGLPGLGGLGSIGHIDGCDTGVSQAGHIHFRYRHDTNIMMDEFLFQDQNSGFSSIRHSLLLSPAKI